MSDQNGTSPAVEDDEVYVKFGPRPTQVVPISWAEQIIQDYMRRYPSAFAKIMGQVALEGYQKETKTRAGQ